MKEFSARCRFLLYRGLERVLPPVVLRGLLLPFAMARSGGRGVAPFPALPSCLGSQIPVRRSQPRTRRFLDQTLECFADRLTAPKWRGRCRIEGLEHAVNAQRSGRPVIFAFCHFGSERLLRLWLRTAGGLPVSVLTAGAARHRASIKRLFDQIYPFPEIPTVFYLDEVNEMARFVAGGNMILIALDHVGGKRIQVPVESGWNFNMSTGALRLAVRHEAEVLPCFIVNEGPWRFRIGIKPPVPRHLLRSGAELEAAGKWIVDALMPVFREFPEQCSPQLLESFRRSDITPSGQIRGQGESMRSR